MQCKAQLQYAPEAPGECQFNRYKKFPGRPNGGSTSVGGL